MIAIIDYGMGNLRSVQKALAAVGAEARVTSSSEEILSARAAVLPGVGAFGDCMENLKNLNLIDTVRRFIDSGRPFLGICLGLQLLFEESEEFGPVRGLGILPGKVVRFASDTGTDNGVHLKIPHMGWNSVRWRGPSPFCEGIPDDGYFYFVHSYYVQPADPAMIAATTTYGREFVSAVRHKNILAFQFHPEKSQKLGLALLKNFSRPH